MRGWMKFVLNGCLAFGPLLFAPQTFVAAATSPQETQSLEEQVRLMVDRERSMRTELEQLLLERYSRLTQAQRVLAEATLGECAGRRASDRDPLPLSCLLQVDPPLARASEDSDESSRAQAWKRFVSAIDLRPVPGVFGARREGRGEAITVEVAPLWSEPFPAPAAGAVRAQLKWFGPSGEEVIAREEPVNLSSFATGFEMYLRPPAAEPGVWQLGLQITEKGGVHQSRRIPVECIDELPKVREQLAARVGAEPLPIERYLHRRLDELSRLGLRRVNGVRLMNLIEAWQMPQGEAAGKVEAFRMEGFDSAGQVLWRLRAAEESRKVVVLSAGDFESPLDLLSGPLGQTWSDFAESTGYRVIAAQIDLPGAGGLQIDALVAALRSKLGVREVVLVARGDLGRSLPQHMAAGGGEGIDRVVISETLAARVPLGDRVALPLLQIEDSAGVDEVHDRRNAKDQAHRHLRCLAPQPFVAWKTAGFLKDWLKQG